MSATTTMEHPSNRPVVGSLSFEAVRTAHDTLVLLLFLNKRLRRVVQDQSKTNLESIWTEVAGTLSEKSNARLARIFEPLEIHQRIVEGLAGEALFLSAAMAFDSMAEALRLFDLTAKTARQRIGERLSASESEIALRIGRVLTMAQDVLVSTEAARDFLRTPNFALGGAVPRDLLKTAEGEQLVLAELNAQAEGGPV